MVGTISHVVKDQQWWFPTCLCGSPVSVVNGSLYCSMCQVHCIDVIPRYSIKVIVTHVNGINLFILRDREIAQLLKKGCAAMFKENPDLLQSFYHKIVPVRIASEIVQCKVVFMVDPRPVGYALGRSVYIVRQLWDEQSLVNLFEDAADHPNQMAYAANKGKMVVHSDEYHLGFPAQQHQSNTFPSTQQPMFLPPPHDHSGKGTVSEQLIGESSAKPEKKTSRR
ncbi:hypothetical protein PIB30_117161 [Stylosanthes scabra]|nr:hypothetical protein [Stylosanthes scabra]